jgi:DNA-binding transcriptional MerR regulator
MVSLSIGEVAQRCGVSVRALRLYESEGLLSPARSLAGRRVYGAADLARMHQVLVLKRAGWSLAQIGQLLRAGPLDPARLLDAQIGVMQQRATALDQSLRALKAARARLSTGGTLTVDILCDLIKTGENCMTDDGWTDVFARYYAPEDMERWRQAKAMTDTPTQEEYGRSWAELIARVEAAMGDAITPSDARAMALACEWCDLQKPMVEKLGAATWTKAGKMYAEMDQWQTETVRAPFSADVYEFVSAAVDAARAAGLMPARAG